MYKVQETCDNCKHCNFIGEMCMCFNKEGEMYNKEVDISGICDSYEKGVSWEEE